MRDFAGQPVAGDVEYDERQLAYLLWETAGEPVAVKLDHTEILHPADLRRYPTRESVTGELEVAGYPSG